MTLVPSSQQPQYASTSGAEKRTDDLRRRNVADTTSNVNGNIKTVMDGEKEDKIKEKVNRYDSLSVKGHILEDVLLAAVNQLVSLPSANLHCL